MSRTCLGKNYVKNTITPNYHKMIQELLDGKAKYIYSSMTLSDFMSDEVSLRNIKSLNPNAAKINVKSIEYSTNLKNVPEDTLTYRTLVKDVSYSDITRQFGENFLTDLSKYNIPIVGGDSKANKYPFLGSCKLGPSLTKIVYDTVDDSYTPLSNKVDLSLCTNLTWDNMGDNGFNYSYKASIPTVLPSNMTVDNTWLFEHEFGFYRANQYVEIPIKNGEPITIGNQYSYIKPVDTNYTGKQEIIVPDLGYKCCIDITESMPYKDSNNKGYYRIYVHNPSGIIFHGINNKNSEGFNIYFYSIESFLHSKLMIECSTNVENLISILFTDANGKNRITTFRYMERNPDSPSERYVETYFSSYPVTIGDKQYEREYGRKIWRDYLQKSSLTYISNAVTYAKYLSESGIEVHLPSSVRDIYTLPLNTAGIYWRYDKENFLNIKFYPYWLIGGMNIYKGMMNYRYYYDVVTSNTKINDPVPVYDSNNKKFAEVDPITGLIKEVK